ncbi:hypothetical protein PanWU01x14_251770 [Parasponia andersonii]|uniref:Uncharacterized protein n=1 Tax=Parasponia andersonii TaxID=3476 RepID=A0A2P5BCB1_PARAD|nr:hypothetical protein PanWU01x14_251770 [Parasponia andersonii]
MTLRALGEREGVEVFRWGLRRNRYGLRIVGATWGFPIGCESEVGTHVRFGWEGEVGSTLRASAEVVSSGKVLHGCLIFCEPLGFGRTYRNCNRN